ncbi:hypothetical protein ABH978_008319, partial [Bradyrhizobium ottawaense]
ELSARIEWWNCKCLNLKADFVGNAGLQRPLASAREIPGTLLGRER